MNTQMTMANIFNDINKYSNQLLQCLTKEHDALSLNQFDKLLSLSESKQNLVTMLDELDKTRTSISGKSDFIEYLRQLDIKLVSQWKSVCKVIKKCQSQNEINGRILARRNSIARHTMDILTGNAHSDATTYGPKGLTNSSKSLVTNIQV